MCIIFVAHHVHPRFPLIIASNRDEYLERPTEPMKIWPRGLDAGDDAVGGDAADGAAPEHRSGHRYRRVSLAGRDLAR